MPEAVVTVAIPYYREGLDYLTRATNSLQGQDFSAWRALIIDDSPLGERQIPSAMSSYKKPIGYKRNVGEHGIGNAWNACIDGTDTELFCILHSDDQLEPTYLSRMIRLARRFPEASMYFCAATTIDPQGGKVFSLPDRVKDFICPRSEPIIVEGAKGVARLMIGNYIVCPTIMYRRSKIGTRRFSTSHRFVLDFRFTLGALFDGETIVGTHQRLYRYRRHEEQATAQLRKTDQRFQEELDLFREVERAAVDIGWNNVARWARMRPTFRINARLYRNARV